MKNYIITLFSGILFATTSFGQSQNINLFAGAGPSFNGTGDAGGYSIVNEIDFPVGKRFFLSPGFQFTNHTEIENLVFSELRFVTTGVNLYANINYLLLNKPRHRISFGVGPALRLQTSSAPSLVSAATSPSGEQILTLKYDDPVHTLALGYNVTPAYFYQVTKRFFLGAKFILQNDTRGDIISSAVLVAGVSLESTRHNLKKHFRNSSRR